MELLTTGAFARESGLSRKALRVYEGDGVLLPAAVDAGTGYRYYAREQLATARLVARLRQIDMPLARVRDVCALASADAAVAVAAGERVALVGGEGGDVDQTDDVAGLRHGVRDDHPAVGVADREDRPVDLIDEAGHVGGMGSW